MFYCALFLYCQSAVPASTLQGSSMCCSCTHAAILHCALFLAPWSNARLCAVPAYPKKCSTVHCSCIHVVMLHSSVHSSGRHWAMFQCTLLQQPPGNVPLCAVPASTEQRSCIHATMLHRAVFLGCLQGPVFPRCWRPPRLRLPDCRQEQLLTYRQAGRKAGTGGRRREEGSGGDSEA